MPRIPHILTVLPTLSDAPTPASVRERVAAVLGIATAEDWALGSDWYSDHAAEIIGELEIHYAVPARTVAGMLAAMSAGYAWTYSTEHIGTLLEGSRDGIAAPYGWSAIRDAESIRDGADPAVVLLKSNGRPSKRWNFFYGLLQGYATAFGGTVEIPAFRVRPTIDVHMARGLTGGFWKATPSSDRRYRLLSDAVEEEATRRSMNFHDLQAVLWTVIRGAAH